MYLERLQDAGIKYPRILKAKHPYEDRDTEYVLAGIQHFDGEQFPLYTADEGKGTTVSLQTIVQRETEDLLMLLGLTDILK